MIGLCIAKVRYVDFSPSRISVNRRVPPTTESTGSTPLFGRVRDLVTEMYSVLDDLSTAVNFLLIFIPRVSKAHRQNPNSLVHSFLVS